MATIVAGEARASSQRQMGDKTKALDSQQVLKRMNTASDAKVFVVTCKVPQLGKTKKPCSQQRHLYGVSLSSSPSRSRDSSGMQSRARTAGDRNVERAR